MKRKIVIWIVLLAVVALFSGAALLALASPGTQTDPFITLSYLTSIFKPQVMADADKLGKELAQEFDGQIDELEARLESAQSSGTASQGAADKFSVVTLSRGQSLTCSVGAEIMLRIGTATGFGSDPALVNYTDGETLSAGASLKTNNMYIVTIENNGVKATADLVRVLVRGSYKLT